MQAKAVCKSWLHANNGWPTLIPYDVTIIFDGKKQAGNTQIWWGWVKNGQKMKNGYKSFGANCRIVQDQRHCTGAFNTQILIPHKATMSFACDFGPQKNFRCGFALVLICRECGAERGSVSSLVTFGPSEEEAKSILSTIVSVWLSTIISCCLAMFFSLLISWSKVRLASVGGFLVLESSLDQEVADINVLSQRKGFPRSDWVVIVFRSWGRLSLEALLVKLEKPNFQLVKLHKWF